MAGADRTQENTLSHTASTFGADAVDLIENQTNPQDKSPVISFTGPKEYERTEYVGRRHPTKFVPRTVEEFEAAGNEFDLEGRIQPVAGERRLSDQDYPAVEVMNVTQDMEIDLDDIEVSYSTGTVTIPDDQVADGDTVKVYPIVTEGTAQFVGINQFDQQEGPTDKWETPLYRWHDMEQGKRGTEVNLQGRIKFGRNESMELHVDSPRTIVWEEADYPGAYVSSFEQKVEITL